MANRLKLAEQQAKEASAREKSLNENIVALTQDNEKRKSELTTAQGTLKETERQKAAALAEVAKIAKENDALANRLKLAEQQAKEASAREKSLNENIVALTQDNEKRKSELTTAQGTLKETERQKAAALAEVAKIAKEYDALANRLKLAEQQAKEASAREKSLNENIVALTQDNEKRKSELTTAQGTLKETERQKAAALAEVAKIAKEKDELADGIEQAEQKLTAASTLEGTLRAQIDKLARENKDKNAQLLALQAQLKVAQDEKADIENKAKLFMDNIKTKAQAFIDETNQARSSASAREEALDAQIGNLTEAIKKQGSELSTLKAQLQTAQEAKAATEAERDRITKEKAELADKLGEAEQKIAAASAREKALDDTMLALTQDNEKHKSELSTALALLEEARKQKAAAEAKLAEIAKSRSDLTSELIKLKEALLPATKEQSEIANTIQLLTTENTAQKVRLEDLDGKLTAAEERKVELFAQLEQKDRELIEAQKSSSPLSQINSDLTSERDRLLVTLEGKERDLDALRTIISGHEETILRLNAEVGELDKKKESLSMALEEANDEIARLNKLLSALRKEQEGLKQKEQISVENLDKSIEANAKHEKEVKTLKKLLEKTAKARDDLLHGMEENTVALRQAQTARAEMQKGIAEKTAEVKQAEAEKAKLQQGYDELLVFSEEAVSKIEELKAKIDALESQPKWGLSSRPEMSSSPSKEGKREVEASEEQDKAQDLTMQDLGMQNSEVQDTHARVVDLAEALKPFGGIGYFIQDPDQRKLFNTNHDLLDEGLKITLSLDERTKKITSMKVDVGVSLLEKRKQIQAATRELKAHFAAKIITFVDSSGIPSADTLLKRIKEVYGTLLAAPKTKLHTISAHYKKPLNDFCTKFDAVFPSFSKLIDEFNTEYEKLKGLNALHGISDEVLLNKIRNPIAASQPYAAQLHPAHDAYFAVQLFCESEFFDLFKTMPSKHILELEQLANLNRLVLSREGKDHSSYPKDLIKTLENFKTSFRNLLKIS